MKWLLVEDTINSYVRTTFKLDYCQMSKLLDERYYELYSFIVEHVSFILNFKKLRINIYFFHPVS